MELSNGIFRIDGSDVKYINHANKSSAWQDFKGFVKSYEVDSIGDLHVKLMDGSTKWVLGKSTVDSYLTNIQNTTCDRLMITDRDYLPAAKYKLCTSEILTHLLNAIGDQKNRHDLLKSSHDRLSFTVSRLELTKSHSIYRFKQTICVSAGVFLSLTLFYCGYTLAKRGCLSRLWSKFGKQNTSQVEDMQNTDKGEVPSDLVSLDEIVPTMFRVNPVHDLDKVKEACCIVGRAIRPVIVGILCATPSIVTTIALFKRISGSHGYF